MVIAKLMTVNNFSRFKLNLVYDRRSRKIDMILFCGPRGQNWTRRRKLKECKYSEAFFHFCSINGMKLADT